VEISGIGTFDRDEYGLLVSEPRPIGAFGSKAMRFELDGYEGDAHPEDFVRAVQNILAATDRLLLDATDFVHQYCLDELADWGDDAPSIEMQRPADVWEYVDLGSVLILSRDHGRGRDVFASLECECAWEPEHGLQLVFRNGSEISKVGPFDGHVSNASAYDDDTLEGVVYKRLAD
jgi:hypothetical protein